MAEGLQKISEVKVSCQKKKLLIRTDSRPMHSHPGPHRQIFFQRPTLTLIFLQPLDQIECLVPHLKDLFHICLEPEAQGNNMTSRVCNLSLKQFHLYNAYLVRVAFQLHTTVPQFRAKNLEGGCIPQCFYGDFLFIHKYLSYKIKKVRRTCQIL